MKSSNLKIKMPTCALVFFQLTSRAETTSSIWIFIFLPKKRCLVFRLKMILNKMKTEKINKQIHKLLLSLQNLKGKHFIVGTIFISGLGILKITIDLEEKKLMDFEKKSFFDIMKIIKK